MARSIKQAAAAIVLASGFIVALESVELKPYLDGGGVPTVCVGHTSSVDMRKIYTHKECYGLLDVDMLVAAKAVDRLVKVPLTDNERIAYISFVFNVGSGAFAKSTMLKLINDQKFIAACEQFDRWVYDNGVKVKGLANRRRIEKAKCLEPDPIKEDTHVLLSQLEKYRSSSVNAIRMLWSS